jgi:hypothetical protein
LLITALIVISPGVVWWCGVMVWCGGVVWWWFISTDNNTTPNNVVLSCFGLLVWLWQYLDISNVIKVFLKVPTCKCQNMKKSDLKTMVEVI